MNILLAQTSFLGDTILATPVIAGIHRIYPDARLWMMTTPASVSLVAGDPLLSGVITFDKRGKETGILGILRMAKRLKSMKFDRVYALHRSFRTALLLKLAQIPERIGFSDATLPFLYTHTRRRLMSAHEVIRNLSLLIPEMPIKTLSTELRLFAPQASALTQKVRDLLPPAGQYAVLVPGSVWNTKMWFWQGYRETAKHLRNAGFPVVLDGSPKDRPLLDKIGKDLDVVNLAGISDIEDAMHIIRFARMVVCNDSMALHLASAFKIPTVAVFCATSPSLGFYPWKNPFARVVEKRNLPCRPCGRHGGKTCPTGISACTNELAPAEVIHAAHRLLP
jgi:heptosyltransferase II